MNAYKTIGLLLSSVLFAAPACTTSVIGGGDTTTNPGGTTMGVGGDGSGTTNPGGTDTGTTNPGGTTTGVGGAGTGTATCTSTATINTNLSTDSFDTSCTGDADCIPVPSGDACTTCCANSAVASSDANAYESDWAAAKAACCAVQPCNVNCPNITASCQNGKCVFGM